MNTHLDRYSRVSLFATSILALAACGGGSGGSQNNEPTAATASTSSGSSGATSDTSTAPSAEATASSSSPAPSMETTSETSTAPAAPAIPDAAMHVQSQAGATGWFARIDIERRDDASLRFGGQEIGRMNAGRITTLDGQAVPLEGRLSIGVRGHREHLEMRPDGSVVMDAGRLTIDPSGEVQITRGTTTRPVHVHVTGYSAATAPLAALLLTYGIMKADLSTR